MKQISVILTILMVTTSCNYDTSEITNEGIRLHEAGQFKEAILKFDVAINKNSEDTAAYFYRGKSLFNQNRFIEAKSDFDKILEMTPGDTRSHYYRGLCNTANGALDEAVSDLSFVIEKGEGDQFTHFYRGTCYLIKGDTIKGTSDITKAISIDNTYAEAFLVLGKLKMAEGKNYLGEQYLLQASNLGSNNASKLLKSNTTKQGTRDCLIGYDWVYPSAADAMVAWKFSSDGSFNSSSLLLGAMSTWGNWTVVSPGKIKVSYTRSTTGEIPDDQILNLSSCEVLNVGSTTFSKY